jgi:carbonic anhydrase
MRHVALLVIAASLIGCVNAPKRDLTDAKSIDTTTKAEQQALTPAQALGQLKAGHERFKSGQSRAQDYPAQVKITGEGQFPYATILSCIDSRAAPEILFDLALGDAFAPRIAGNIVDEDILGSMEFASKVAGSKLIVVLGHTHCGAIKGACDDVQMGNLTGLLAKIRPTVDAQESPAGTDRSSKNSAFVDAVAASNVRQTIADIRSRSSILKAMEDEGTIKIVGAMYDIETGVVDFYE